MILYFVGALNGDYAPITRRLDPEPDWVLCVGSFGVWPDPQAVDKASKRHGAGDFHRRYADQVPLPYPTLFVEGTHEDHRWLKSRTVRGQFEILPNATLLKNGNSTIIGDLDHSIKVLGLGKPYSPKMDGPHYPWVVPPYYTNREVEAACAQGPVDILLSHEGLHGQIYGGKACEAKGIQKIVYATRPKLMVHGHFNAYRKYSFMGTQCYSLANGQLLRAEYDGNSFNCAIIC